MFYTVKQLPKPDEILKTCPLSPQLKEKKEQFDEELRENLRTKERFTVICGPCSADNPSAVAEYARKLFAMSLRFSNLFAVARVYTAKPHSNGVGYRGLCFQPNQNTPCNLSEGIVACRKMMLYVLEIGLPIADELLYPELFPYFSDLVSYWFVGARSSEDNFHRDFASGLDMPCGVKNPTNGLIDFGINSLFAVANPCVFPFSGAQMQTNGNKFAHIVLRGGNDQNGFFNNISREDTALCKKQLAEHNLCDFVMADLSHANSCKSAVNQLVNAEKAAQDPNIDGAMAESYLFSGTAEDTYGVSKTDDCLDIVSTEKLLEILSDGFAKRAV